MRSPALLLVALAMGCGSKSHDSGSADDDDIGGGADADGDADDEPDAAADRDSGAPSCAAPRVHCEAPPPRCPAGHYPAVSPERCEFGTSCVDRCWTGECLACGDQCRTDADCALVGRWGCCDFSGGGGCRWAAATADLARDPCLYDFGLPRPDAPPEGCSSECFEGPECLECPHCGPDDTRCEGGFCRKVYTNCEPEGCWGCQ